MGKKNQFLKGFFKNAWKKHFRSRNSKYIFRSILKIQTKIDCIFNFIF